MLEAVGSTRSTEKVVGATISDDSINLCIRQIGTPNIHYGYYDRNIIIPNEALKDIMSIVIDMFMESLEGIHKMLYDLRKNNKDKAVVVLVPREDGSNSMLKCIHYDGYKIGDGVSDTEAVRNILQVWSKFSVENIYEKEDGTKILIYLKYPANSQEEDE